MQRLAIFTRTPNAHAYTHITPFLYIYIFISHKYTEQSVCRPFVAHPNDIPKHLIIKIANILHCSCAFFKAISRISPYLGGSGDGGGGDDGHLTEYTSHCFNVALLYNAFIPSNTWSQSSKKKRENEIRVRARRKIR